MVPNVKIGKINIFQFIQFPVKSAVWTQVNRKKNSKIDPLQANVDVFAVAVAE
jgi:hypothetical protein